MQNGLFDHRKSFELLGRKQRYTAVVESTGPWDDFRSDLEVIYTHVRKSHAGRRPFDIVLMFKILILQPLYTLSDVE